MARTFYWRCEGTTLANNGTDDLWASDNTATAIGSPAIGSGAARVGSNGIVISEGSEGYWFDITGLCSRLLGNVGLWFRFSGSYPAGTLFEISDDSNTAHHIRLSTTGTDELRMSVRNPDVGPPVTLDTTAANLAADTWYFIVAKWDQANSDRRIEVYNSDMSLRHAVENTSTAYDPPTTVTRFNIGEVTNVGGMTIHLDNIFVGDGYDDDLVAIATIAAWSEIGGGGGGGSVHHLHLTTLGVG